MNTRSSSLPNLVPLVWSALFTALIAAGAYLSIPFWPVPLTLANFFVDLAGLVLGPWWGGFSILLYLGLGALGLPVFTNGAAGYVHFAGPTGGFLVGYLLCVVVTGLLRDPQGKALWRNFWAILIGVLVLYAAGIPVLALFGKMDLWKAALVMIPYFAVDVVKAVIAVLLTRLLFTGLPRLGAKR